MASAATFFAECRGTSWSTGLFRSTVVAGDRSAGVLRGSAWRGKGSPDPCDYVGIKASSHCRSHVRIRVLKNTHPCWSRGLKDLQTT
ncbi:hypothetical protein HN51_009248 [Arachis hypogaea]